MRKHFSRLFPDGKITANALKQAQLSAQAEFEEAHQEFSFRNWDAAYGSAGTIGAVADIGLASGLTNGVVTPALLKVMRKELVEAGDIRKINFPGLKEDRREVIAGALPSSQPCSIRSRSKKCARPPGRFASVFSTTCWDAKSSATRATAP